MTEQLLREKAAQVAEWTAQTRRQLHRIPEIGFDLFKTQRLVMEKLDEIGVPYTTERTWVIAEIRGALPGKTVGIRADMDALPIQENTGLPFQSEHPGCMHACGHDAHAAILLGTAKVLWSLRDQIPGTVRLLFQPAEETVGGAVPMIAAGAMDGVDAVYALHMASQAPVGRISTRAGATHANTDEFIIHALGQAGHGAHPSGGVDGIVIAAQMITALQTLITREFEATDSIILTIGSIHGGSACNILCDDVKMHGTLRTLRPETRQRMHERIPALCKGIARAMGGDATVEIMNGYNAAINDDREAERVLTVARRLFGDDMVKVNALPSMGGEDFGFFLEKAPGAMYQLGTGSVETLHNEGFIIDEDSLPVGVLMHTALVFDYLEEGNP